MNALENIGMLIEAIWAGITMTSLARKLKKEGIDLSKFNFWTDFTLFEEIVDRITELQDAKFRQREIAKLIKMEFGCRFDLMVKANES